MLIATSMTHGCSDNEYAKYGRLSLAGDDDRAKLELSASIHLTLWGLTTLVATLYLVTPHLTHHFTSEFFG